MTLFEILNFNRELLERLAGTGYIKAADHKRNVLFLFSAQHKAQHK